MSGHFSRSFGAIGTTVTIVTAEPDQLDRATEVVTDHVAALDQTASRFRADSEISAVNQAGGRSIAVSPDLFVALEQALRAAAETDGLVNPTIGDALVRIGYDRDFASVAGDGPALTVLLQPAPGWRGIRLDRRRQRVRVPAGVRIDLGATAKAGCADRAALAAAAEVGSGVLVNLGGDIAVAGVPPSDGWPIRIADRHDAGIEAEGVTVSIRAGGLATSGTAARRWQRGGQLMHHVIDPATGLPAHPCWRTVTVAAESCLAANVASTAAVILGQGAPGWLSERHHHARLVAEDGTVTRVGNWPSDALEPDYPRATVGRQSTC